MEVHTKITLLYRNGIIVYPVVEDKKFKIACKVKGKEHIFPKVISKESLNSKVWKENPLCLTIDYLLKKHRLT